MNKKDKIIEELQEKIRIMEFREERLKEHLQNLIWLNDDLHMKLYEAHKPKPINQPRKESQENGGNHGKV